jgi:ketosteroid isomerase-like protein
MIVHVPKPAWIKQRTAAQLMATVVLTLLCVAPAFAQDPARSFTDSVPLPADLDRVLRDYEGAWRARDAAALAALFTEDGFVLSPGRPPVRGRGAIERRYATSGGPLVLRALAYATADSVGYIIGAYASEAGVPDNGKFVLTLRRGGDGRWLISADMDNGNGADE